MKSILVGSTGIVLSEVAQALNIPILGATETVVKIVVQIIIGVCTLIGLWKTKKSNFKKRE